LKSRLSELLALALSGIELEILKHGKPIARIGPIPQPTPEAIQQPGPANQ